MPKLTSIDPHLIDLSGRDVERYLWQIRFWAKIDRGGGDDACWPWIGGCKKDSGHGITSFYGRKRVQLYTTKLAHRIAYQLIKGPIPSHLMACHRCDNPLCCNPDHIFIGTQTDNMRDMFAKGRNKIPPRNDFIPQARRGEEHYMAKLKDADIPVIRGLLSSDVPGRDIAVKYGVSYATIRLIAQGKIWRHVGGRHAT